MDRDLIKGFSYLSGCCFVHPRPHYVAGIAYGVLIKGVSSFLPAVATVYISVSRSYKNSPEKSQSPKRS